MKRCLDCQHFEERASECRRNPPMIDANDADGLADFPVVNHNTWCGEFEERKVNERTASH
jgi:hypothetical protein